MLLEVLPVVDEGVESRRVREPALDLVHVLGQVRVVEEDEGRGAGHVDAHHVPELLL